MVLGGAGFIGSAIVKEARRRGYEVIAVTRENYDEHAGGNCDLLINANGNSKKYLARGNPAVDFELSVKSVENSLKDFNAECYVYISSIDVYLDVADSSKNSEDVIIETGNLPTYGLHKYQAEMLVRQFAKSWLILRAGGMVGPHLWKNSIYDILKNQPLRVHPDSQYQYLHTEVFAHFAFELISKNHPGFVLNVVGDGLITPAEAAKCVPEYDMSNIDRNLPVEKYEINLDRLKALFTVPGTSDTVSKFIKDVRCGRESIM